MRKLMTAVLLAAALPVCAATTNNNDSCDIGTYPAATLLLPYFEVTLGTAGSGNTTIFSVTNVSPAPQIARVTLWTDWAFPVLSFNIFLTGYDVQPINLYDIIARGLIGGTIGTSTSSPNARDATGKSTNPNSGTTPLTNLANPNFAATVAANCAAGHLPGQLPQPLVNDVRLALTTGTPTGHTISCKDASGVQQQIGSNHGANYAVGYATIDVVNTCSPAMPVDAVYWNELLYDNVLTGDYAQIANDPNLGNYAGGNPMVHIRAIAPGVLPFTFYDRFTKTDRRQPLPSTFSARWIEGTSAFFNTDFILWREGLTNGSSACTDYSKNFQLSYREIVRFDEHENASTSVDTGIIIPEHPAFVPATSATLRIRSDAMPFPIMVSNDAGGWMYFNLTNGDDATRATQNWVVVSMFAEGRFGVEYDATALGNGCSPAAARSDTAQIGPRP